MSKRTKKSLSDSAILLRVRKYCALRERSLKEVKQKLIELEVNEEHISGIIKKLENEGFLNEKRYVLAFAGGKFRTKKWGKAKIEMELRKQNISGEMLTKGLEAITREEYVNTLNELLKRKMRNMKIGNIEMDLFSAEAQKLIRYAVQKGYEYELVVDRIKQLLL